MGWTFEKYEDYYHEAFKAQHDAFEAVILNSNLS